MENNENKSNTVEEVVNETIEKNDTAYGEYKEAVNGPELVEKHLESKNDESDNVKEEEVIRPLINIYPYRGEMTGEEINFNPKDYSFDVSNEREFYIEPFIPLVVHTGIKLESREPIYYRFTSNIDCVNKDSLIVVSNDIHTDGEIVLTMLWLGADTGSNRFKTFKVESKKLNKFFKINFISKTKCKVLKVPAETVLARAVAFVSPFSK